MNNIIMVTGNSYNYALNAVKLMMAVIIVIYHHNLHRLGWDSDFFLRGGYLCVDAFFVISGFLVARMILSMPHDTSFLSWLKRRMKSIYPCYIVALFFAFAVGSYFVGLPDMRGIVSLLKEILMIHEWGIIPGSKYYNSATWYISAMMFVSCAYFLLSQKFTPKKREYIIAGLSVLCLSAYSYLFRAYTRSRYHEEIYFVRNHAGLLWNGNRLVTFHLQGQNQAQISRCVICIVSDYDYGGVSLC